MFVDEYCEAIEAYEPESMATNVTHKRISIIGAARSGLAVAQLLRSKGADLFVSDSGSSEKLTPSIEVMKSSHIEFEIGAHTDRVFDADFIVLSPGVPSNIPVVKEAVRRGKNIVSEVEVASWFCRGPIVVITGTNGKTTTTTLVGRMFHDAKRKHFVAGNIGSAFSGMVSEIDEQTAAILEISSFQLDHIESFHPHVSVILNLTPDHLDRYDGSFEKYAESKCRVFKNQIQSDYAIYNYDDVEVRTRVMNLAGLHVNTLAFGIDRNFDEGAFVRDGMLFTSVNGKETAIIETDQISIKGIHNLYNSMGAALTAQTMGISVPSIRATLKNFKGVEHRLEFVRELNGIKYINDSKATNIDSVWYALQAYREPIVLLLGGRDKGNDYSKLYALVDRHVKAIVAIGESAEKVVKVFADRKKTVTASSMDEAVRTATTLAQAGDIVLLSPACASFDWFENYEHRGRVFKDIVHTL